MADEDTRKRVYQQDELDAAISSKRAALGHGYSQTPFPHEDSTEPLFFKLLCPQGVTGLIIGKGGANIIQLNTTTGARIKLSQNNEYFPNTSDRILLISGGREGMQNAIRELVTRIVEAPEKRTPDFGNPATTHNNRGANGTFVVRVLVPKHASASIIGKGGSVIKRMTEMSGCRFQLGEEADPYNSNERIVTVTGTTSANVVTGAVTVMNTLLDDPRIRVYSNPTTNYSGRPPHGGGPVPMGAPGMHPHMMGPPQAGMMPPQPMMGYGPQGPYMAPYPGMPQHMPQHMGHPMFQQGSPAYPPQYGGMPTSAPMHAPVAAPVYPGYPPAQPSEAPQSFQPPAHYGGAKPAAYGAPPGGMTHPSPYQGGMHPPKMN